ncbi:MAG TPA: hypothetical protein VHF89_01505 [Solirubrobacteraceae bacterium]|nr:hypothetical protein [Solirubrobacteraceae bacterium]
MNGRRVARRRGRAARRPVTLRRLPRRAFVLTIRLRASDGRTYTVRRRYGPCR